MNTAVLAFPLHRRRKLVADLACVLGSKHGEDATLFWRETAKTLLLQLTAAGIAGEHAEGQVRSLLYAVVTEMESGAAEIGRR